MKPPDGMRLALDHDGATWVCGGSAQLLLFAAGALAHAGALVLVALSLWVAAAALGLLGVGAVVLALRSGPERLRVTVRTLSAGALVLRLDDVDQVTIGTDVITDRSALVVRTTRGDRHVLAIGAPPEHLRCFLEMVEGARGVDAERARIEGREWSFLRYAPEAVTRLRAR